MILEEAYSNNPKPDKQARLEIVQRVSLNEKEVQVWRALRSSLHDGSNGNACISCSHSP